MTSAGFYKTVYTCDICNVASFPTMEEAVLHESSCSGPTANATARHDIPQAPISVNDPSPSSWAGRHTFYKCNCCKLLFEDGDAADAHEATCTDSAWESCRVCQVMRFRGERDRLAHEETCGGAASYSVEEIPLVRDENAAACNDVGGRSLGGSEQEVIELQSSDDEDCDGDGQGQLRSSVLSSSKDEEQQQQQQAIQKAKPGPSVEASNRAVKSEPSSAVTASQSESHKEKEGGAGSISKADKSSSAGSEQPSEELPGKHATEPSQNNGGGGEDEGNNGNGQGNNNENDAVGGLKEGYTTVWSCDFCKDVFPDKKFEDFDQALAHEKICEYNPDNNKKKIIADNDKPPASPPKLIGPASKKITLLSPVLSASDATVTQSSTITKPSPHFCTILQSLDLLYHPYSALISFNCRYCKNQLPTTGLKWNLNRVVEVLPNMTTKHLLGDDYDNGVETTNGGCTAAPAEVVKKLQSADNTVESFRVRTFETFIQSHLAETNIVARKTDRSLVYGPAQTAGGKYSPGNLGKKRRGSDNTNTGDGPSPGKKQKDDVDVYPPSLKVKIGNMGAVVQSTDDGDQFYMVPAAPLDGVPLVSSITSEESKKLPLPLQTLLQQVEFFNLSSLKLAPDEIMKEPTLNAVGMRCQNCLTNHHGCGYIPLTSVKELPSDLLAMATDHIIYCRFTKTLVRNTLKDYVTADKDKHAALKKYCQLISKLYGLENTTSNNKSKTVVYGECPSIPSGYIGSPKNIDINFAL